MLLTRLLTGFAALLLLAASAAAQMQQADIPALERLIAEGVPVIDIRTAGEWRETGVIADSHLLTFFDEKGNYDVAAWLAKLGEIAAPGQPVAIMCQVGSRSLVLSNFLATRAGYARVYNVTGGIEDWIKHGGAVVRH